MTQTYTSQIILASASPRRKQLLSKAGYQFSVVPPEIDESAYSTEQIDSERYARQLALAKAKSIAEKHPENLVISADTIVDFQGEIIGKPADAKEARQIIQKLFSEPHHALTIRICLIYLKHGKFGIMPNRDALVPEISVEFVNLVKPAHKKPL